MGINDRMIFVTPPAEELSVPKAKVEGRTCPECGSGEILRYPIGSHLGPRMVVKCQTCFHTLELQRPEAEDNWPPFRAATYDWVASRAERP